MPTLLARTWRGTTAADDADAYLDYLHATGLAAYRAAPGNRGVLALRRVAGGRAEWLLVTLWDDLAAVCAFAGAPAGADPTRAVFYPEDDRFLTARDEHAAHYEVAYLAGGVAP
jgi:heme-degrading monooxygenase HmoA